MTELFHQIRKYIGASTDTKPTAATNGCTTGSTFFEYDTFLMYITYDGTNWVLKPDNVKIVSASGDDIVDDIRDSVKVTRGSKFGEPSLNSANNGSANWCKGSVSPLDQKSSTGWLACLYGGIQTGDDWARVDIPVDELLVTGFDTAKWSYYMSATETMGVNIVVWVHDPTDFDKRAEITQLGGHADLEKAAGWNAFEFDEDTEGMFFYGEGTTGTDLTAGTQYSWSDFQADALFSTWTIYRITIEYGWESGSNEFTDAWVADIMLNGELIPLKPDSGGSGRIARRSVDTATTLALTIAPKTPWRLLTCDVHASAILDTGEVLTLTKDAGLGTSFDGVVLSEDLFIGSRTSYFATFGEGYDFDAADELDAAQANGSSDTIGLALRYQTVFN